MKNLKIKSDYDTDVAIKYFIDNELNAPHINSVIFLYCLKNFEIITNVTQICVKTNTTNEQVQNALEFWEAKGLCNIEHSQQDDIHKVTLLVKPLTVIETQNNVVNTTNENTTNDTEVTKPVTIQKRADYKPEEIKYFMSESNELKQMFDRASASLCKPLSHPDMNAIIDMNDRLRLPYDLVNAIIDYCVMNNKRNMRYISGMAQNMSDLGINTIEKFNVYTDKNKDIYKEVLTALNATNPMASPAQMKIIDKWLNELGFSLDVILEACDKACINTSNPTLNYVDGILKNWQKEGIKTVLDVQEYETKYLENKNKLNSAKNTNNKIDLNSVQTKKSNFNNFDGRNYDYDSIAKKLDISYKG